MTDDSSSNADDDKDAIEEAGEEIDEEPGAGMGPGADMDKADPAEEEDEKNPPAKDDSGSNKDPDE